MTMQPSEPKSAGNDISVLVVTYNRQVEVLRCLDSIFSQTVLPREVVVYDNASEDQTVECIRKRFPSVAIVESEENLGCPIGRNRGIDACDGEYVLCVDDDGTLARDAIEMLARTLSMQPKVTVVAGAVIDAYHPRSESLSAGPTFTFSGGIAAVHRETFRSLGGYHEDGLRQGEETELSFRLYDKQFLVYRDPSIRLVHHVEDTETRRRLIVTSGMRQSILTALKVVPFPLLAPWMLWKILSHAREAVRWGMLNAAFAGASEAWSKIPDALRERRTVRIRTAIASTRFYVPPKNIVSPRSGAHAD